MGEHSITVTDQTFEDAISRRNTRFGRLLGGVVRSVPYGRPGAR